MRADRLVSILLLLQNHGRMTAGQLASRLEVSRRTILRDIVALGSAGVPVITDRGTHGGLSLMDGYRAKLTAFSEGELRALAASAPPRVLADLDLTDASERVRLKVTSTLDPVQQRIATIARERLHIDSAGWGSAREPVPHLRTFEEAVWQERCVRITYGDHLENERMLAPLGLVAKGSAWYVVAISEEAIRTYRVSRVHSAALTDERFARPAAFDLATYWAESSTRFRAALPRYDVVLRTSAGDVRWIETMMRYGAVDSVSEIGDARVEMRMHFDTMEVACSVLLGVGDRIEIVEPQELRERVIETARRVLSAQCE